MEVWVLSLRSQNLKKIKKTIKLEKEFCFFVAIVLLFSLYIKQRDNALRDCALNCSEPAVKMTALKKVRKFNKGGEVLLFESVKTKLLFNSNYALAAASARHGEKLYPLSWRFKFIQAEIYFKTLNYLRAKEKIKDVLLIEPNCLSAKFRLSEILYEEGEFKAAFKEVLAIEKILKNLKALNPSGYNKALLRFNRDKYNKFKKQIWKMKKSGKIIV